MTMLKFFEVVCKTGAISLVSINLTQKQSQDVQLDLLNRNIKLIFIWIKSKV